MKLFRNLRGKLLKEKKIGNYIGYAVGEIILVVIGILIAVSLNNWNENRKQAKELDSIFSIVAANLKNDVAEVEKVLTHYENVKPMFVQILQDSITRADYQLDPRYAFLTIGFPEVSFDKRGYNLLVNFNTNVEKIKDTLAPHIIDFYTERMHEIKADDDIRASDFRENFSHYKKNYTWWADFITGKSKEDFITYALTDLDYKNRVATTHFTAYLVFLPELEKFKKQAEVILAEIKKRE